MNLKNRKQGRMERRRRRKRKRKGQSISRDDCLTLQQELLLILMQIRIPVMLTQECNTPVIDKKLSPLRGSQHRKRCYTMPKNNQEGPSLRYKTLENNKQIITSARSKRISSAAVAKKFPKDFFKNEKCLQPIRSSRSNSNNQYINFIDTFSHKIFAVYPVNDEKQLKSQRDTPKFKQKNNQNNHLGQSLRYKITSLIQQKQLDRYFRDQTGEKCPLLQIKEGIKLDNKFQIKPFQGIPQSGFNVTLGQKIAQSIIAQKNQKKKKVQQKQNIEAKKIQDQNKQIKDGLQGFRIRKRTQML